MVADGLSWTICDLSVEKGNREKAKTRLNAFGNRLNAFGNRLNAFGNRLNAFGNRLNALKSRLNAFTFLVIPLFSRGSHWSKPWGRTRPFTLERAQAQKCFYPSFPPPTPFPSKAPPPPPPSPPSSFPPSRGALTCVGRRKVDSLASGPPALAVECFHVDAVVCSQRQTPNCHSNF